MRRVMLIALAVVAALGVTASTATTETGVTAKNVTIGGTFPLTGPASLYATIPVAMKAYFSYINARKGPDGKRGVGGRQIVFNYNDDGYNPANSGAAHARPRRAGQGVRGRRVARHRGEPRDSAVPELEEGAAHARRDRRDDVGRRLEAVPVDDRLAAGLPVRGQDLRRRRSPATARTPRSASSTRTTTTARTCLAGLEAGLGAKTSNIVGKEAFEVTAPERGLADREAAGERRDGLRHHRDAEVHDPGVRDRRRRSAGTRGDLHERRSRRPTRS